MQRVGRLLFSSHIVRAGVKGRRLMADDTRPANSAMNATSEPAPLTVPDGFEWYDMQIAGHHQNVVKNGVRQIGT